MKSTISPTMRELMDYMAHHDGKICRFPGGFWACEHWPGTSQKSFGTTSVQALVGRGIADWIEWKEGKGFRFPVTAMLRTLPMTDKTKITTL